MSKLRVLCLHGFTSNGSVHAYQVRKITKPLSADFDFLFPDGPHEVEITSQMKLDDPATKSWSEYVSANSTSGHRAWWFARDGNPSSNKPGGFVGLERSVEYLSDLIQKTGPVHAIWGFSQGGCFAGTLMALLSDQLKDHPLRQRFPKTQGMPSAGIFFSGFKARFSQYDSIYAPGIGVPTLHIFGEQDTMVTPKSSETLVGICQDATVLRHAGGHNIPTSEEDQEKIIRFLRDKVHLENSEDPRNIGVYGQ